MNTILNELLSPLGSLPSDWESITSATVISTIQNYDVSNPNPKLLGVSFDNYLYDLNIQTGLASNPRYTVQIPLIDIAQAPDGKLYGISLQGRATPPNAFPSSLYLIDSDTGKTSLVQRTNILPITEGDLDFDPTTGVMYGVLTQTVFPTLFTINTANGQATQVATIGNQIRDISGIAFDANGRLYALDTKNDEFLEINKLSGEVITNLPLITSTGTKVDLGSTAGMDFNPVTGELFVADGDGIAGLGTNKLYTLNITNGVLNSIGDLGLSKGLSGLEFVWTSAPTPVPDTLTSSPMYRFKNMDQPGTYLFAGGEEAKNIRVNFKNFKEEGLAFSVATEKNDPLLQDFYRFRNTASGREGTYLFAGAEEAASIRANFKDFVEEGLAFYAYPGGMGTADFSRFQNSAIRGTYLFAGPTETASILANFPNFIYEGIAFGASG